MSLAVASPTRFAILAFNASNQLAVRRTTGGLDVAFRGATLPEADAALAAGFRDHLPPAEYFTTSLDGEPCTASFTQVAGQPATPDLAFLSLDALAGRAAELSPALAALLGELDPHLVDIPYLHLGENDINAKKPHATITHCFVKKRVFSEARAQQFYSLRNMISGRR